MISIVFSAYNEEDNVAEFHRQIISALQNLHEPYEVIAVDNASTDNTLAELKKLSPIKIISLDKNFGQASGLDAGIYSAGGELVCTMDADLQNDPIDIPPMLKKIREGYDVVVGWRKDRYDSLGRRLFSLFANGVTNLFTGLRIHDNSCGIKVFKKKFLGDLHISGIMHIFLPAILVSRGAKITELPVRHHERTRGISKYSILKMSTYGVSLLKICFKYIYRERLTKWLHTFSIK
ncbi:MAG: glycosyltransferase family 2 protein [Candidatus Giovannonibacteria bacterium]|nr:glycosyltransferase family 2 protein [Candidatus Giovannonibacteria bacterium]